MKQHRLLMLLLAFAFLMGCSDSSSTCPPTIDTTTVPTTLPTTENTTVPATEPTTAPTFPFFVYKNAVEDYLLPLEEFSDPRSFTPEYVMIHFTSAVVEHRDDPYNMQYIRGIYAEYGISVHYLVERDGTVRCHIPEHRVAWHAGKGEFGNDPKYTNQMNQYAIGIEVLAIGSESDMSIYLTNQEYQALDDSLKGYTPEQYHALKLLIADLCARYSIPMDRSHVIGHDEYAPQKSDPGELFDWSQIIPQE